MEAKTLGEIDRLDPDPGQPDAQVLDDMRAVAGDRKWQTAWATMLREKAVLDPLELYVAIEKLARFIRPVLVAVVSNEAPPDRWEPGGPWRSS